MRTTRIVTLLFLIALLLVSIGAYGLSTPSVDGENSSLAERPTPRPVRTRTPTPIPPTDTPTPIPPTDTPTAEPIPEHDVTAWHVPGIAFHHHGADPSSAHPDILAYLQEHPEYGEIGHPWASSPTENVFPWPAGKHEGWTLLVETNAPARGILGANQLDVIVESYFIWIHDLGNAHEMRTRVHSWKGIFRVCDRATLTNCGLVASGGWQDFGERHSEYKRTGCILPDNPAFPPEYSVFGPAPQFAQAPYVAVSGTPRQWIYWNAAVNPVIEPFLGHDHDLFVIGFSARPWETPAQDPTNCGLPEFDTAFCPAGGCANNKTQFQMFVLYLQLEDYPRPYQGFVDRWGAPVTGCTEVGLNCIPLTIGVGVPTGNANLNRHVRVSNNTYAPILNYDDGAELHMPGYQE